jgi:hypothetical protein
LNPLIELDKDQFGKPAASGKFPDFRTVLFWNSGLEKEIQTSSLTGKYLFWVKYLDEKGEEKLSRFYLNVSL